VKLTKSGEEYVSSDHEGGVKVKQSMGIIPPSESIAVVDCPEENQCEGGD